MGARAAVALVALVAFAPIAANYQASSTIVIEVSKCHQRSQELSQHLQQVKSEALELYTEGSAKLAADLKCFFQFLSALVQQTQRDAYISRPWDSNSRCCHEFQARVRKTEADAHKAATFSTETHHKFLLGHMIVFRIHLNKSDEFIKRSERILRTCGTRCEIISKVHRWHRLARCEIDRVRRDMEYASKVYEDLLLHGLRRLNQLRKHTQNKLQAAAATFRTCRDDGPFDGASESQQDTDNDGIPID